MEALWGFSDYHSDVASVRSSVGEADSSEVSSTSSHRSTEAVCFYKPVHRLRSFSSDVDCTTTRIPTETSSREHAKPESELRARQLHRAQAYETLTGAAHKQEEKRTRHESNNQQQRPAILQPSSGAPLVPAKALSERNRKNRPPSLKLRHDSSDEEESRSIYSNATYSFVPRSGNPTMPSSVQSSRITKLTGYDRGRSSSHFSKPVETVFAPTGPVRRMVTPPPSSPSTTPLSIRERSLSRGSFFSDRPRQKSPSLFVRAQERVEKNMHLNLQKAGLRPLSGFELRSIIKSPVEDVAFFSTKLTGPTQPPTAPVEYCPKAPFSMKWRNRKRRMAFSESEADPATLEQQGNDGNKRDSLFLGDISIVSPNSDTFFASEWSQQERIRHEQETEPCFPSSLSTRLHDQQGSGPSPASSEVEQQIEASGTPRYVPYRPVRDSTIDDREDLPSQQSRRSSAQSLLSLPQSLEQTPLSVQQSSRLTFPPLMRKKGKRNLRRDEEML